VISSSVIYSNLKAGYASSAGNADTLDGYHASVSGSATTGVPIINSQVTYTNLKAGYASNSDTLDGYHANEILRTKKLTTILTEEQCCTRTNAGSCGMPGYSNVLTVPAESFLLGLKARWEDKSTCEYSSTSTSISIAGYSVSESWVYNGWTQTAWHSAVGLKDNLLKEVTYNVGASTYIPCGGTHTTCVRNIELTLYYIDHS
jgi:hypothetical protein